MTCFDEPTPREIERTTMARIHGGQDPQLDHMHDLPSGLSLYYSNGAHTLIPRQGDGAATFLPPGYFGQKE